MDSSQSRFEPKPGTFHNQALTTASMVNANSVQQHNDVKIQRLDGKNWFEWKWQIINLLTIKGLIDHVKSATNSADPEKERQAMTIFINTIDQTIVKKLTQCSNSQEIWKALNMLYENSTGFVATDLCAQLFNFKFQRLADVEAGMNEIRQMAARIRGMGTQLDEASVEGAILKALPRTFSGFVQTWKFQPASYRTVENLQTWVISTLIELRRQEVEDCDNKVLLAKSKAGNKDLPVDWKKDLSCHYCDEKGHFAKDCLKKKRDKESKCTHPIRTL